MDDFNENLAIEYLEVDKLQPYERNAKKHGSEDVEEIAKSIQAYGFDDPIGIWSDKNVIVEGHGRLMAAKKLGLKEVPVIRLDFMTDEQRKAYGLLHNKLAELSRWDFDKLDEEIEALELKDFPDFKVDLEEEESKDEEKPEDDEGKEKMLVLNLTEPQYQIVLKVIDYNNKNTELAHTWGNSNKKSNAIFEGVYLWAQTQNLI